ncbi:hypothetical protein AB0K74_17700 [Streptomyces sp. NPDC056159]|uniref:hypothetical protein n=1 Tax=Streptomyces sp. NPDC056159 TaxID=3155537 RepID=UPI00342B5584
MVAARVAAVLEDAWQRLAAHQAAVIAAIGDNERSLMVADRLAQSQAAMVDFRRRVDAEALAFVSRQLPHLYEEGTRAAARAAGGPFTWTLIHREALQSLASDSYADFLRRSKEEQRMAAQFVWRRCTSAAGSGGCWAGRRRLSTRARRADPAPESGGRAGSPGPPTTPPDMRARIRRFTELVSSGAR